MIETTVNTGLSAILFTTNTCGACKPVELKIKQLIDTDFPQINFTTIRLEENAELRGKHLVFSAPTFILFFDGKEYLRESGIFSVYELQEKIAKIYTII